jgi:hypothetical protein
VGVASESSWFVWGCPFCGVLYSGYHILVYIRIYTNILHMSDMGVPTCQLDIWDIRGYTLASCDILCDVGYVNTCPICVIYAFIWAYVMALYYML